MNASVVARMRRVTLLLSMFLASAVCLGQSSISPVVTATPEQLFNWAEKNFASLFPPGTTTQTLSDPGGLVNYRQYKATGNAIAVQNQNILGKEMAGKEMAGHPPKFAVC